MGSLRHALALTDFPCICSTVSSSPWCFTPTQVKKQHDKRWYAKTYETVSQENWESLSDLLRYVVSKIKIEFIFLISFCSFILFFFEAQKFPMLPISSMCVVLLILFRPKFRHMAHYFMIKFVVQIYHV